MEDQQRVESQEGSTMFADGVGSRPLPQNTIAAGPDAMREVSVGQTSEIANALRTARVDGDEAYVEGSSDGELVDTVPAQVLERYEFRDLIERGQQRFNISCVPCHDHTGSGNGMVARRGFKYPPSYHTERLRAQPLGYIFNVMTHGRGQMPSYGDFISTDDRWAIAAYVRTLQFSQYAPVDELSEQDVEKLKETK